MNEQRDRLGFESEDVRQAYRTLPDDVAPPALDERVLEAARTALEKPRGAAWKRWSAPLALAASVIVVVTVVLDPGARKEATVRSMAAPRQADAVQKREAPRAAAAESDLPAVKEAAREQPAEAPPEKIPNIDVTAQRRSEPMQDVPIAIGALHEDAAAYAPPKLEPPPLSAPAAPPMTADDARAAAPRPLDANGSAPATAAEASKQSRTDENEEVRVTAAAQAPAPPTPIADASSKRQETKGQSSVEEFAVAGSPASDVEMRRWLRKIQALQSEGNRRRAAREIDKFKREYPGVDVEKELERLRRESQR